MKKGKVTVKDPMLIIRFVDYKSGNAITQLRIL